MAPSEVLYKSQAPDHHTDIVKSGTYIWAKTGFQVIKKLHIEIRL